jgi:hypothetical protein
LALASALSERISFAGRTIAAHSSPEGNTDPGGSNSKRIAGTVVAGWVLAAIERGPESSEQAVTAAAAVATSTATTAARRGVRPFARFDTLASSRHDEALCPPQVRRRRAPS